MLNPTSPHIFQGWSLASEKHAKKMPLDSSEEQHGGDGKPPCRMLCAVSKLTRRNTTDPPAA